MARKLTMNVDVRMMQNAEDEFAYVYGHTMAAWADVERSLYHWFYYITRLKDGLARGIYYGAKGFAARLDMLEAAIEHTPELPTKDREFITKAVNKARSYSAFRNAIAHGEPIPNLIHRRMKPGDQVENGEPKVMQPDEIRFQMIQAKDVQGRGFWIEDIARAHDRFHMLAGAINDAVPHHRKDTPLAQFLAQVIALPNEPYSKNDPTPTTPSQSPQPGGRVNKKEHRAAQAAKKKPQGSE